MLPKTHVLKLGGAVCQDPAAMQTLVVGLKAAAGRGDRWVLVHGGGPQLDTALRALQEPVVKVDGLRVTSPRAAAVVQEELDGVGATLCALLHEAGIAAYHAASSQARFEARPKVLGHGLDLGRVGTVERFDAADLPSDVVTVVTPVGFDSDGPLNVNADEGAAAVAAALHAERLVIVTDVPHVRDADGTALLVLDPGACMELITQKAARDGMIPKLQAALWALGNGAGEVLVASLHPALFSARIGAGVGTRIAEAPALGIGAAA